MAISVFLVDALERPDFVARASIERLMERKLPFVRHWKRSQIWKEALFRTLMGLFNKAVYKLVEIYQSKCIVIIKQQKELIHLLSFLEVFKQI